MAKLYNLARVQTATTGTGTITLGLAVSGYLTFALAGVANGETVAYGIKDGVNSEVGTGVYTSAGTTLTRTVTKSTNSDAAISLSGTAEVYITARKEDVANAATNLTAAGLITGGGDLSADRTFTVTAAAKSDQQAGSSNVLAVTPLHQQDHPSAAKAWVQFTVSGGVVTVNASYNIASVVRNGTGDFTITFTTAFASANYVPAGMTRKTASNNALFVAIDRVNAPTSSALRIATANDIGTNEDPAAVAVVVFGTQ
jgi:hypothetical protein